MVAKKANPLPPWASVNIEPKRKFKFQLAFGDVPAWVVKTAARPSMAISADAKHNFMSHEFKFPGRVTWEPIEVTLLDVIDPDIASAMFEIVEKAGYVVPSQWTNDNEGWKKSLSKRRFSTDNIGDVSIITLNSDGKEVERWTLRNTWVHNVKYDDVSYDDDGLMSITIGLTFDYAEIKTTLINP